MADVATLDDLVRRMAAATRGATLYSPSHPLVQRGVDALAALCQTLLEQTDSLVIGFLGDDVVVNAQRLPRSASALAGFARDLREREIEKISVARGVMKEELSTFVLELADRRSPLALSARLDQKGVRNITICRINVEQDPPASPGMAAVKQVFDTAVATAEELWDTGEAGDKSD